MKAVGASFEGSVKDDPNRGLKIRGGGQSRGRDTSCFQRPHTVEQCGDGHRLSVDHAPIAPTCDMPHQGILS